MAEPVTTALILTLAAQKFAEGAAGKAAEKLIERLWDAIADRFKGRKKTEENLKAIAIAKGEDAAALEKVETVLDAEFVEDEEFRGELEAIVIEIQKAEPERVQKMLVGIRTSRGIKAQALSQEGAKIQEMLVDIEAESLDLGNLSQSQ